MQDKEQAPPSYFCALYIDVVPLLIRTNVGFHLNMSPAVLLSAVLL